MTFLYKSNAYFIIYPHQNMMRIVTTNRLFNFTNPLLKLRIYK
jgi:hypothetical protein